MHPSPLFLAVLNDTPIDKKLLEYDWNEAYKGWTPLTLSKYLGRRQWLIHFLSYPHEKEAYFTQNIPYHFTPHLLFPSFEALCTARGKTPSKKEWIEYGEAYDKEIGEGYVAESTIQKINDHIGYGLFSNKNYTQGDFIGEYVGLVGEHSSYLRFHNYLYQYPIPGSIGRPLSIDAEHYSNHVRFINHSDTPNCIMKYALYDGIPHAILIAQTAIYCGEQFTYDYGTSFWLLRGRSNIIKI